MYKIIGGDGNEYGPITAEQLRQWITEGRVNGQTQVQAAGSTDWKTLAEFPEFADALIPGSAPTPAPTPFRPVTTASLGLNSGSREAALQAVKGPAIALKVTAIIGLVLVGLGLIMNILTLAGVQFGMQQVGDPQLQRLFSKFGGTMGIVQDIIGAAVGIIILMGASKMQNLQNYQYAFTACVLAMIPCVSPCCLLGLPFGIWAMTLLMKPEIKSQFN